MLAIRADDNNNFSFQTLLSVDLVKPILNFTTVFVISLTVNSEVSNLNFEVLCLAFAYFFHLTTVICTFPPPLNNQSI